MLTAHHLSKSYNLNLLFSEVSFNLNPGDRVGLIGPNGSGKTALLRILAGQELPEAGTVTCDPPDLQIGYLPQGFELDPARTLGDVLQEALGDPAALETELSRLALELALDPGRNGVQDAYDRTLRRMERLDPAAAGRADALLRHLGLRHLPGDLLVERLSGGQKTRLSLALILLANPRLLLLDEPTNHLDVGMLEWLESWLSESYTGAALIVSHDRAFLDNTVTRILDLDPLAHTVREYPGTYSDYLELVLAGRERQASAYRDQVYEIRRMKQDIAHTKQQARWVEITTTSRQPGVRRYAKKVAQKAKSREKKLERYIESDERVEKPRAGWQMKLDFSELPGNLGQDVLILENLAVGYRGFPPLLNGIDLHVRARRRVVLTGPNGLGKTTLLRTIAGLIPPVTGNVRLGASVRLGYMPQEQELLAPEKSALEIIQGVAPFNETEARSFLHYFLFSDDDPLRPSSQLSYGERARLLLAQLVAQGSNFLLLDEPINHLDIPSRERFEQALAQFDGAVLAVVHDRYFIQRFATDVWVAGGAQPGGILTRILRE